MNVELVQNEFAHASQTIWRKYSHWLREHKIEMFDTLASTTANPLHLTRTVYRSAHQRNGSARATATPAAAQPAPAPESATETQGPRTAAFWVPVITAAATAVGGAIVYVIQAIG